MSFQFSRRKMIFAGGAALAASSAISCKQPMEATTTSLASTDRELSAISGNDPGFSAAVESLYPGLTSDPMFKKMAPLALLVTHKSGKGLRALSVSWKVSSSSGTYETALFSFLSPGSGVRGYSTSTLASARKIILKKGASRLITPFFSWTPGYYQRNPKPDWKQLMAASEPGGFLMSELSAGQSISTSLDAALFRDWKIMGPDTHNLARRVRSRRHAEHDEAGFMLKLIHSKASDEKIANILQKRGSVMRSIKSNGPLRWYEQGRRFQAQVLYRHFTEADRKTFVKALKRLKRQPRTVITRLEA